jgi:hypothetical protein
MINASPESSYSRIVVSACIHTPRTYDAVHPARAMKSFILNAPDRGLGRNCWFVGCFLRYGGVAALVLAVCSPPDCDSTTSVENGAFGCRRPTQFVVTAGRVNRCSTPQIASTTKHSAIVGLIPFSGQINLDSERAKINHEQATEHKQSQKPWAPKQIAEAKIAMHQTTSIEAQRNTDWPVECELWSIAGV